MVAIPDSAVIPRPDLQLVPPLPEINRSPLALQTEGRVNEWFQALDQKRIWSEAHDPRADTIQAELDLAGGGMRGIMHVGLLSALHNRGLLPYISRVVGVSTGILAALVGWGMITPAAFNAYLQIAQEGYVSSQPHRMARRDPIQLDSIQEFLASLISEDKIRDGNTQFSSVVTNAETGGAEEIDLLAEDEILKTAMSSAAVPGLTKSPIKMVLSDGREIYAFDGMASSPYPGTKLDKKITHRLVVTSYPPGKDIPDYQLHYMAADPRLLRYPAARRAIRNLNTAGKRDMANIRADISGRQPNTGLIYPNIDVGPFTQDWQNVLRPYQLAAEEEYRELIEGALDTSIRFPNFSTDTNRRWNGAVSNFLKA